MTRPNGAMAQVVVDGNLSEFIATRFTAMDVAAVEAINGARIVRNSAMRVTNRAGALIEYGMGFIGLAA